MKLKRFTQFVNKVNEDLEPQEDFDNVEDFKKELGEDELSEDDFDFEDEEDETPELGMPSLDTEDSLEDDFEEEDDLEDDFDSEVEEEEEAGEYIGTVMMKDLASKLGVEVVNNEIDYNGQKINFYSETEKFHVGKNKFKTVDEVLDFLKGDEEVKEESPEIEEMEEEPIVSEKRRYIRKF